MSARKQAVFDAIDAVNKQDPNLEDGQPAELLYGQRMSAELDRVFPDASEILQIAARGQHVERWKLARSEYPDGRAGYLAWRKAQGVHHAKVIAEMMSQAGYSRKRPTLPHVCCESRASNAMMMFRRWKTSSVLFSSSGISHPSQKSTPPRKSSELLRKLHARCRQTVGRGFWLSSICQTSLPRRFRTEARGPCACDKPRSSNPA